MKFIIITPVPSWSQWLLLYMQGWRRARWGGKPPRTSQAHGARNWQQGALDLGITGKPKWHRRIVVGQSVGRYSELFYAGLGVQGRILGNQPWECHRGTECVEPGLSYIAVASPEEANRHMDDFLVGKRIYAHPYSVIHPMILVLELHRPIQVKAPCSRVRTARSQAQRNLHRDSSTL